MQLKLNYKLILIFIFLVGAFTSALFQIEGQDDIDGTIDSAGTNNPAVINAFELRDTNVSPSTLTPNTTVVNPTEEYVMVLDLVEIDGLADIETISFKFFNLDRPLSQIRDSFDSYTSTGILEKDSSFPGFMLSNDAFVVTWDREDNSFTLEGGGSTTWALVQTTMTAVSSTNFVFEIQFRVSKVALNNNAWYIGALVSNGLVNQRPEDDFFFEGFYGMNWYGEIEVVSGTGVQWDEVDAGTDFYGPNTTASMINVSTGDLASVKYITNGYYQQRIFSSAQWVATEASLPLVGEDNFATLTTNSAQSAFTPQTFGIGVALDYDDINVNTRLDSVPITLRGHLLDLDSYNPILWRSRTLESGRTFSNLIFRVALANSFQNATYQGTINLGISNETDIIPAATALSFAENGLVTSGAFVGVYAENEEELKDLLANNNIQVPIYLRNGFIEITTAPAITIANTALKPVIGDVFITGDNISITNLTMLYGDLHIIGNSILLTNTQLTSHSPGGDLYVKGTQFTGSSINVEGSVFVSNNASGIITQDDTNDAVFSPLKIKENVFVSENSTLTINNYEIGSILNGRGNINVTGNSVIVLSNQTLFNDLNLHNSVGELQGTHFSGSGSRSGSLGRPLGINVNLYASHIDIQTASLESLNLRLGSTADKTNGLTNIVNLFTQSFFDMKNGEVDSMRIAEESTLHMLTGTVNERIRMTNSEVIISGGTIGNSGDGNLNEYGILVDDLQSFSGTPSTLTISGNPTIKNIKARHLSTIDMSGGSITHITDLANQVNLTLLGGTIHYARTFNSAVIDMSAGTIRKAHLFNTTALNVSGGTLGQGNGNASLISLNEQSTLDMYGGTINLGTMSNDKVDADFIDSSSDSRTQTIVNVNSSNSKQGLQIRDDATVTLSGITIESMTESRAKR
jgi:hypothetical protein